MKTVFRLIVAHALFTSRWWSSAADLPSPSEATDTHSEGRHHQESSCNVKELLGHAKALRCDDLRNALLSDESCARAADKSGRTALHWIGGNARLQGDTNEHEREYILGKSGFCTQVYIAFAGPKSIWSVDSSGMLPLHWAAANGMSEVAATLIISSRNKDGTPKALSNINIMEAQEATKGMTPLLVACSHNHLETIRVLVSNKADVNSLDNDGQSCLIKAVLNGRKDIIEFLVSEAKVDTNIRDMESKLKWSACHFGVFAGRKEVISQLLDLKSCDIDMEDSEGLTPYALAGVIPDREEIRNLLVNYRISSIQARHRAWEDARPIPRPHGPLEERNIGHSPTSL